MSNLVVCNQTGKTPTCHRCPDGKAHPVVPPQYPDAEARVIRRICMEGRVPLDIQIIAAVPKQGALL